ncbi:hypothetical protein, partial [Schnuerera sp.]|uniref:hypothetical protein n=1 Tax=Schnuerera sp. TaxID=2794844 RepID=UPI002BBC8197
MLIISGALNIFSSDIVFSLLRSILFTLANNRISIYMITTEKITDTKQLIKLGLDAYPILGSGGY